MKRSKKKRRGAQAPKSELRLPKALYTTGWSDIVESWHKRETTDVVGGEEAIRLAMVFEGLRTAEALVVSPAICCHVHGENVVLCRLIEAFGVAGVEQLLEEGALQFLLWRPFTGYANAGQAPIDPLTSGNLTSPPHCDPQESVEAALKGGWCREPWPKVERVARLAIESTHLPAENVPHDAVAAVREAYDRGLLRRDGFDPNRNRSDLDNGDRQKLSKIAGDVAKGIVLYDCEFDLHESDLSWAQMLRFGAIARAASAPPEVDQGLRLEGVPNVAQLILSGAMELSEIVTLRNHSATQELRKWLWSQPDPRDAEAVAREWLSEMTTTPLKDRAWFKAVRVSSFSIAGGAIGAAVGGPPGFVGGAAVGAALNQALGILDAYGLEKALSKPGPRRFAEFVRTRAAQHATRHTGAAGANRKERRAAEKRSNGRPR